MKKLAILLIAISTTAITWADSSILSLKQSITDKAIVYPESFETDTKQMMQNWYLLNYAVLDDDVENRKSNDVSDAVYIERLKKMPTEIEMPFNSVVKSYIQMYTQKRRTLVEAMLGMSLYYMPIFEQALEKEGLPLELKYLPVIESALNPNAVSRVGATGLWQFMIKTAKGLGLEVNSLVDERRDPYRSSEKAAKYLKELYSIYNDWSLAIAAYNCGPGNVNKALRRAGGSKKDFWEIYAFLPAETRGYVPAFIAANYVMTYFKAHNINPGLAKRPLITDTVHVTKRVNLQQIADVLDLPLEEIQILNPHFRKNIIPGDSRPYALSLPSQQIYSYIMSEDSIIAYKSDKFGRRDVVEPKTYTSSQDGERQLVVKRHKVRKGETLAKIAKKYGVTTSSISKANKLRKNRIRTGQTLKINTYVYVPKPVEEETPAEKEEIATAAAAEPETGTTENSAAENTSTEAETSSDETVSESAEDAEIVIDESAEEEKVAEPEPEPKPKVTEKKTTKKAAAKPQTHKVRKGETLGKIASRYGVTVNQLKRANGLKSTKIKVGQRLTIPAK